MEDRAPLYPGRVTLTPVPGQANKYDMVRADEPTQVGSALNKANLLPDNVANNLGLSENPQVKDAFQKLLSMITNGNGYIYVVTVTNSDGTPLRNVEVGGMSPVSGNAVVTNSSGQVTGFSANNKVTLSISGYLDIPNSTKTVDATATVTNCSWIITKYANDYRKVTSSGDYKISSNVSTLDVCLVGGGGGGSGGASSGGGGGGGYVTNKLNIANPGNANIVIGGGGTGYNLNTSQDAFSGGTTKFNNYTASGGKGADGVNGGAGNGAGGNYDQAGTPGTVREFGESSRQLYSGGGGGSKVTGFYNTNCSGGSPYGGAGEQDGKGYGGGGGGGGYRNHCNSNGYQGVVAVRWRYS